ncbi:MAG: hypothetical protein ACI8RC_001828, partial [Ilumatobacter sp.]
ANVRCATVHPQLTKTPDQHDVVVGRSARRPRQL